MKEKTTIDNLGNGGCCGAISRRAFLRGTACAALAGAGACTGIPSFGKLRMDETLVAILSDCHVGAWNSPEYQGVDRVGTDPAERAFRDFNPLNDFRIG